MKNRIILLSNLFVFFLFAVLYMYGFFDFSKPESRATTSWHPDLTVASPGSSSSPNADNVSSSYYDKINKLEVYLATNPEDTSHILRLARLYQEGHQPKKASEWYEKYLEINTTDVQALLDLANTYGEAGLWKDALKATERLLSIHPDNLQALYNNAAIHANMGNLEQAKLLWEEIVSQNQDGEITEMSQNALQKLSKM